MKKCREYVCTPTSGSFTEFVLSDHSKVAMSEQKPMDRFIPLPGEFIPSHGIPPIPIEFTIGKVGQLSCSITNDMKDEIKDKKETCEKRKHQFHDSPWKVLDFSRLPKNGLDVFAYQDVKRVHFYNSCKDLSHKVAPSKMSVPWVRRLIH